MPRQKPRRRGRRLRPRTAGSRGIVRELQLRGVAVFAHVVSGGGPVAAAPGSGAASRTVCVSLDAPTLERAWSLSLSVPARESGAAVLERVARGLRAGRGDAGGFELEFDVLGTRGRGPWLRVPEVHPKSRASARPAPPPPVQKPSEDSVDLQQSLWSLQTSVYRSGQRYKLGAKAPALAETFQRTGALSVKVPPPLHYPRSPAAVDGMYRRRFVPRERLRRMQFGPPSPAASALSQAMGDTEGLAWHTTWGVPTRAPVVGEPYFGATTAAGPPASAGSGSAAPAPAGGDPDPHPDDGAAADFVDLARSHSRSSAASSAASSLPPTDADEPPPPSSSSNEGDADDGGGAPTPPPPQPNVTVHMWGQAADSRAPFVSPEASTSDHDAPEDDDEDHHDHPEPESDVKPDVKPDQPRTRGPRRDSVYKRMRAAVRASMWGNVHPAHPEAPKPEPEPEPEESGLASPRTLAASSQVGARPVARAVRSLHCDWQTSGGKLFVLSAFERGDGSLWLGARGVDSEVLCGLEVRYEQWREYGFRPLAALAHDDRVELARALLANAVVLPASGELRLAEDRQRIWAATRLQCIFRGHKERRRLAAERALLPSDSEVELVQLVSEYLVENWADIAVHNTLLALAPDSSSSDEESAGEESAGEESAGEESAGEESAGEEEGQAEEAEAAGEEEEQQEDEEDEQQSVVEQESSVIADGLGEPDGDDPDAEPDPDAEQEQDQDQDDEEMDQDEAACVIQSAFRTLLEQRTAQREEAARHGIMTAVCGTVQGETGWYTRAPIGPDPLLLYFDVSGPADARRFYPLQALPPLRRSEWEHARQEALDSHAFVELVTAPGSEPHIASNPLSAPPSAAPETPDDDDDGEPDLVSRVFIGSDGVPLLRFGLRPMWSGPATVDGLDLTVDVFPAAQHRRAMIVLRGRVQIEGEGFQASDVLMPAGLLRMPMTERDQARLRRKLGLLRLVAREPRLHLAGPPRPAKLGAVESAAVVIQAHLRRWRAQHAFQGHREDTAFAAGLMAAMPGTIQGHSGWYVDQASSGVSYLHQGDDDEWTVLLGPYSRATWTRAVRLAKGGGSRHVACPPTKRGHSGWYMGRDGRPHKWLVSDDDDWAPDPTDVVPRPANLDEDAPWVNASPVR